LFITTHVEKQCIRALRKFVLLEGHLRKLTINNECDLMHFFIEDERLLYLFGCYDVIYHSSTEGFCLQLFYQVAPTNGRLLPKWKMWH